MHLVSTSRDSAQVELTEEELTILNNALNEVANGLDIPEFATRMGVERDDVRWLLQQLREALEAIARPREE
jgi:hypothetical protein